MFRGDATPLFIFLRSIPAPLPRQQVEWMEYSYVYAGNNILLKRNGKCVTIRTKEVIVMEKTATLNLRVNPTVKQRAENVLAQLGIPMSTAIDMYLNQISLTGGIPFAVTLPKTSPEINADMMNTDEIHAKLKEGYEEIGMGKIQDAASAFAKFREGH